MFSEYRIHPALLHLLYCLLYSAGEEVVRLQELERNTVTIHTGLTGVQSDAQILWIYGPENADIKIVNSQIIRGEIITDYDSERFRDRLQLNRNSGSLTITNISRDDSGIYKLQIITGRVLVWSFSVNVYAANPVSNQTTQLDITNVCCKAGAIVPRGLSKTLTAVLTPVGLIVALSILFVCIWKKKTKHQVCEDAELNYAEVKTKPQNSHEVNRAGVTEIQDESDLVVYSRIRKQLTISE
ncbi:uncharacterized protein LOC118803746 isoform X2 [Colossoma macropomum]|uniref:uncharacterized protein LOC118803746 isoform X2 n=1 Tax=Colossoma macropomum TaxID=42526 RepID=UPI0018655829|nr:uncharacterized protein LOC118803746 isoform X2 [Colossoma macropomum]